MATSTPDVDSLREQLQSLGLSTQGTKKTLRKTLRKGKKREEHSPQLNKYYLICDIEATCDDKTKIPHEVIEFPVVLLSAV